MNQEKFLEELDYKLDKAKSMLLYCLKNDNNSDYNVDLFITDYNFYRKVKQLAEANEQK